MPPARPIPIQSAAHAVIVGLGIQQKLLVEATSRAQPTVHAWLYKGAKPDDEARQRMHARWPELAPHLWDTAPVGVSLDASGRVRIPGRPLTNEPVVHAPVNPEGPKLAAYEADDLDLSQPGAARALIAAQIARLRKDTAALRAARSDHQTIARAEDAERKAALDLAKVAGELAPNEVAKIVRSNQWRRIRDTVINALAPWPDALDAVVAAVEELEANA